MSPALSDAYGSNFHSAKMQRNIQAYNRYLWGNSLFAYPQL